MLQAYFKLNASNESAQQYLYGDIPCHYTSNNKTCTWQIRKSHFIVISRIRLVSPAQTQLSHLRLLLFNISGAKCYNDLKIIEGHQYQTFGMSGVRLK